MNFKYKEIGKFDARKAAKALLELAQEIKLEDKKERKSEDENDNEKVSWTRTYFVCTGFSFWFIMNYIKEWYTWRWTNILLI